MDKFDYLYGSTILPYLQTSIRQFLNDDILIPAVRLWEYQIDQIVQLHEIMWLQQFHNMSLNCPRGIAVIFFQQPE